MKPLHTSEVVVLELCLVTVFLKTKKILATAAIKKAVQCSVATSGSMMSALDLMNMK